MFATHSKKEANIYLGEENRARTGKK